MESLTEQENKIREEWLKTLPATQYTDTDVRSFKLLSLLMVMIPIVFLFIGIFLNLHNIVWDILTVIISMMIVLMFFSLVSAKTRGMVRVIMHTIDGKVVEIYAKPTPSGILRFEDYGAYKIDHSCGKQSRYSYPYSIGHGSGMCYEYYQGNPFPLKPDGSVLVTEYNSEVLKKAVDSHFAANIHSASADAKKQKGMKDIIPTITLALTVCLVFLMFYQTVTMDKAINGVNDKINAYSTLVSNDYASHPYVNNGGVTGQVILPPKPPGGG